MANQFIIVEGACQNNLKNINIKIPLRKLTVVTGVSGSGKSSLAFDTIYSEGQRRYVETFSAYTRQFLDRMDKPKVKRIDGIPPAIAIDQTNPVRTSRSTVGTMTELNDHLKLLYARAARLYCGTCGRRVQMDTPDTIWKTLSDLFGEREDAPLVFTFSIPVPDNFTVAEVKKLLAQQGYQRFHFESDRQLEVIQDRVKFSVDRKQRIIDDIESAFRYGQGKTAVYSALADQDASDVLHFSADLHCAHCDIHYTDPVPNTFSFNSPIGACEVCRGFGRTIGIDYDLVIPDVSKTLREGAIKPWQTKSYKECQDDLLKYAVKRKVPIDIPWIDLSEKDRQWIIDGEGAWEDGKWYGVVLFFDWLESRSYRMHVRILLSRYRTYRTCTACGGARLKPESLLWRLGPRKGLTIHDVMMLPIEQCLDFFLNLSLPKPVDEANATLLEEVVTRIRYLSEVGLGYLTLDRQSRTLSGGEVQRINLTTALGTSLVNTLFVLDEPSIGLHSRDIGRLIKILRRLRTAGNTLLVVEHDPEVIKAADNVIDMGPGPGEAGGHIVYSGSLTNLLACKSSITADYLTGVKQVSSGGVGHLPGVISSIDDVRTGTLSIFGARHHNLQDIDIHVPLNRLVCITGVSGSGKSTLVQDICFNALCKIMGKSSPAAGKYREITGSELLNDVVLVDQSQIGKTTRSNPVSYIGAFDAIRTLFSETPLSRQRGYTKGTFSFNSGAGRCPLCKGSGFEHVEMQFLSDVYLRCPDCNGRRYRPDVLDVKILPPGKKAAELKKSVTPKSIADILELTVSEAGVFFENVPIVIEALESLRAVGLGYITLGQPVPYLSGGEAQRLKLAGFMTRGRKKKRADQHILFLFDEPTTGLHFDDIALLLGAFRRLIECSHSLVVIEHNLDVISAADWVIDLGPEGGEKGGRVLCAGAPKEISKVTESYTGKALRRLYRDMRVKKDAGVSEMQSSIYGAAKDASIRIMHAREHNLKNINMRIPRDKFTVITGVSGSGKSTVAFDLLFSEGQRRYLESLNAYARQFVQPAAKPDVDGIYGIPPTVAIEQRTSRGGRKSTVATVTEIYHFLRLLFTKLGTQYCPDCDVPIQPQTVEQIVVKILDTHNRKKICLWAPLVSARKGYYTDLAKWAQGKGFAHLRVDGALIGTEIWPRLDRYMEHSIEAPVGEIVVSAANLSMLTEFVERAVELGNGLLYVSESESTKGGDEVFSSVRACSSCGRSFEDLDPRLFSFNSRHGWCPSCFGTGLAISGFDAEQTGEEAQWNEWWEGDEVFCPACNGSRLRPEALSVRFRDMNIADVTSCSAMSAKALFKDMILLGIEDQVARDIKSEVLSRLIFLEEVGLSYLSLDRAAPTLSGGEAQRIRLAAQIGSNLQGVCYILDEPTIGLHARDNAMLLKTIDKLKNKGNTVVVVEHDEATIRHADHIIDLGPGGGVDGGEQVAFGTLEKLMRSKSSLTARLLRNPLVHPVGGNRKKLRDGHFLVINDAHLFNLKHIRVSLPLSLLVCVTGVSGSGKSTLVRQVLFDNLKKILLKKRKKMSTSKAAEFRGCGSITGHEYFDRILEVDQTPIGKTPRSCPATYVGIWDHVRRLYAEIPEARMRGYTPSRFSFNVAGGRCDTCSGQGILKIGMSFLPDVTVQCDACGGRRFDSETLSIRFKDMSIADILSMSVDEAVEFFCFHPSVHRTLNLLKSVGLGYLRLGQQSPTLSGGEAQRIKLVAELAKTGPRSGLRRGGNRNRALYVLDEPTIGLHMADVEKLINVLHKLVDAGNTVVVIEHNLDIIAEADWIIDLGPEGGENGGSVTAEGPPATVARVKKNSYTAEVLREFLKERTGLAH